MFVFPFLVIILSGQQPTQPEFVFTPQLLVWGKALRVEETATAKARRQSCTFVIEHVYAGDPGLKGRTFKTEATVSPAAPSIKGDDVIYVPFREGEVGIWSLTRQPDGTGLVAMVKDTRLRRPVSARRVIEDYPTDRLNCFFQFSFRAVRIWAEAVQRARNKQGQENVDLLKRYCLSEQPLVAPWAIELLGASKPSGYLDFLEDVALNDKATVAAQVAVDGVLSRAESKRWRTSNKRLRMMERWVSGTIGDDDDARRVLDRFQDAITDKEIDFPMAIRLETAWGINQPMFDNWGGIVLFRGKSGTTLSPEQYALANKIQLDFALEQIRTSKDHATRINAANWLLRLDGLDKEQLRPVRIAAQESKEPEVKKVLENVMKDSEAPKK